MPGKRYIQDIAAGFNSIEDNNDVDFNELKDAANKALVAYEAFLNKPEKSYLDKSDIQKDNYTLRHKMSEYLKKNEKNPDEKYAVVAKNYNAIVEKCKYDRENYAPNSLSDALREKNAEIYNKACLVAGINNKAKDSEEKYQVIDKAQKEERREDVYKAIAEYLYIGELERQLSLATADKYVNEHPEEAKQWQDEIFDDLYSDDFSKNAQEFVKNDKFGKMLYDGVMKDYFKTEDSLIAGNKNALKDKLNEILLDHINETYDQAYYDYDRENLSEEEKKKIGEIADELDECREVAYAFTLDCRDDIYLDTFDIRTRAEINGKIEYVYNKEKQEQFEKPVSDYKDRLADAEKKDKELKELNEALNKDIAGYKATVEKCEKQLENIREWNPAKHSPIAMERDKAKENLDNWTPVLADNVKKLEESKKALEELNKEGEKSRSKEAVQERKQAELERRRKNDLYVNVEDYEDKDKSKTTKIVRDPNLAAREMTDFIRTGDLAKATAGDVKLSNDFRKITQNITVETKNIIRHSDYTRKGRSINAPEMGVKISNVLNKNEEIKNEEIIAENENAEELNESFEEINALGDKDSRSLATEAQALTKAEEGVWFGTQQYKDIIAELKEINRLENKLNADKLNAAKQKSGADLQIIGLGENINFEDIDSKDSKVFSHSLWKRETALINRKKDLMLDMDHYINRKLDERDDSSKENENSRKRRHAMTQAQNSLAASIRLAEKGFRLTYDDKPKRGIGAAVHELNFGNKKNQKNQDYNEILKDAEKLNDRLLKGNISGRDMMNEKIRLLNKMIKYLDKEYKNVADKDAAKRNKKNGVDVRAYKFKTMNNQGKHREPTGADELRYKMVLDSYSSIASTLIYDMMTDMSISSQKAETHRDEILKTAARFDVPVERYEKKLEKKKNAELKAEQEKELGKNKPEVKAGEKNEEKANEEMIKNNKKKAVKTNAIF
ncbi:MAG: hypothetical protein IKR27_04460 [Lachnospiraceae bacterium]|nr:hypothetical protein [Lachnospiraceae bacterium]